MPVPLAPYPTPPVPFTPPPPAGNGAQSQLVCSGCRNLLLYPVGASSVCCAVCNAVTAVPPPGTEMAQLVCGGCHTLLMYIRGATSVQCSCCHTVNLAMEANQVAHVNCGNCRMLLMYQYGARSVKCAVCNFVTSIGVSYISQFISFPILWKKKIVYFVETAHEKVNYFCGTDADESFRCLFLWYFQFRVCG
ncbi:OLC1v1031356C2 [Oldenlandia corymbosa var. corymbosa]|uniref:OLC1v1031356C2 n=1 Tax=Oldenlandia corymbosa var. corymbosa TaxID=529605 RepID=A0AAV1CJ10_OLDCO|nr:OLC1v1031356C2 [Oldenlandia corymbosa var. corymbosa]